jgi:hypothetical protein
MHGDHDYLEFLQESTFKNRAFVSKEANPIIEITEDELREELQDLFESDDDLNTFMQEADFAGAVAKWGGYVGKKAVDQAHQTGFNQGANTIAILATAVAAGVVIYKRFMSKAAKQCAGLATGEKTNCMRKIKAEAVKAKISKFESFKSKCNQAKNPTGCNNKLMLKIKAEKSKLGSE